MLKNNMNEKQSNLQGMSLIEIMIVLVLIGMIAGLSLPAFNRLATSPIETESIRISNLVNDLSFRAVLESRQIRLLIDTQKNEYNIQTKNEKSEWVPHDNFQDPIPFSDGVGINPVSNSYTPETGKIIIKFSPIGVVDLFEIVVHSSDQQINVLVNGIVGKVEFGPLEPYFGPSIF